MFGIRKCEHIFPYRVLLNWLTTEGQAQLFCRCSHVKTVSIKHTTYLGDRYIINTSTRPARGYRFPLNIPSFTKEFLENSFYVTSSYLWNSLPPEVRGGATLYSFKQVFFKYLLSLQHQSMPNLRACKKFFKIWNTAFLIVHLSGCGYEQELKTRIRIIFYFLKLSKN